jgi:hypothetical protein
MQITNKRNAKPHIYSIRIAGPSSLNSAKLVFLPLFSSPSIPTSLVHIHVLAYIFTLRLSAHVMQTGGKHK